MEIMAIFDLVILKKALNVAFLNLKTLKIEQIQNSKCLKMSPVTIILSQNMKNIFQNILRNQSFD